MFNFRSQIIIKVLGYFFINLEKKHYINELAEILAVDPGNLFRKLKELETEGILFSEIQGNQRYYRLNKKYPLFNELKKSFEAKYGLVSLLKNKLSKLKNLQEAYIFGSFANNSFQQESDIDILLIGEHSPLEAKRLILPLQNIFKRDFNIIDISTADLEKKKKQNDEFIKNIFSHKIIKLK